MAKQILKSTESIGDVFGIRGDFSLQPTMDVQIAVRDVAGGNPWGSANVELQAKIGDEWIRNGAAFTSEGIQTVQMSPGELYRINITTGGTGLEAFILGDSAY